MTTSTTASLLDGLLVVVLLLNFYALGSTRLRALVTGVSLQGVVLGLMPLLVHPHPHGTVIAIALATVALKGLIIPAMLFRTMRNLTIRREIEPLLGVVPSLILGAVGTALALIFAARLPMAGDAVSHLIVPASIATIFTGLLLLITRKKAITQVTGYLMLDNGIFIFGLLLLEALPALVEVGVLLDLFVGIFIMGIVINHIGREFSSASSDNLSALKE